MIRGFTLIEALIAVVVAGIAVSIACTALVTTLKAEQAAASLRDADLLIRDAAASARLGLKPAETPAGSLGPWKLSGAEASGKIGTNVGAWTVWTLSPADRPTLPVVFTTRP